MKSSMRRTVAAAGGTLAEAWAPSSDTGEWAIDMVPSATIDRLADGVAVVRRGAGLVFVDHPGGVHCLWFAPQKMNMGPRGSGRASITY
jgi:hypothetical protein